MKKRVWMVLVVLAVALSTLGCWVGTVYIGGFGTVPGSGKVVEEEREVSDFTGVELETLGNLIIELGDEEKLRIEAEDNLLQYIETEVHGGELKIGHRHKVTLVPTESIYFYLTVKELDTILVSGAGNVKVPDLEVAEFSLNISGAGDVDMEDLRTNVLEVNISGGGNVDIEDLNADVLKVNISGAGDLYIGDGEVTEQEITISGAGNYKARGLESAEADVRVPGFGSATIRVRDHLEVKISGAGSVKYVGSPTVEEEVSGVGNIEQIGE
jgi:hypothetical protein